MSVDIDTVCPYCGTDNNAATNISNDDEADPRTGDLMICITCAGVSIYSDGHLRKLTPGEWDEIEQEGDVASQVAAAQYAVVAVKLAERQGSTGVRGVRADDN